MVLVKKTVEVSISIEDIDIAYLKNELHRRGYFITAEGDYQAIIDKAMSDQAEEDRRNLPSLLGDADRLCDLVAEWQPCPWLATPERLRA